MSPEMEIARCEVAGGDVVKGHRVGVDLDDGVGPDLGSGPHDGGIVGEECRVELDHVGALEARDRILALSGADGKGGVCAGGSQSRS